MEKSDTQKGNAKVEISNVGSMSSSLGLSVFSPTLIMTSGAGYDFRVFTTHVAFLASIELTKTTQRRTCLHETFTDSKLTVWRVP